MKKLLLASVAALAVAGAASAADLPSKRSSVVAYAPAAGVWTGFYAGVHAGWTGGEFKTTDTATLVKQTQRDNSLSGGALVGYNYQINQFVLGLEADITAFDLEKSKSGNITGLETSSKWLATVRGRVGYAVDRFLPFVTAGVAFTDSKQAYAGAAESKTRTGYALGAGVDYAFTNNIIGRVEYQYAKFDGDKFNVVGDKSDLAFHTVRAAVIYKF